MKTIDMQYPSEFRRPVADNEYLILFGSSIGAVAFDEWWEEEGEPMFIDWCDKTLVFRGLLRDA